MWSFITITFILTDVSANKRSVHDQTDIKQSGIKSAASHLLFNSLDPPAGGHKHIKLCIPRSINAAILFSSD